MWAFISYSAAILTAIFAAIIAWKIYDPGQFSKDDFIKNLIKRLLLSLTIACLFAVIVYKSLNPEKKEAIKPIQNQSSSQSNHAENEKLDAIKEPDGSLKFFSDQCEEKNQQPFKN